MKKYQRGALSGGMIFGLVALVIGLGIGLVLATSYVGAYNYGNQAEQQITAQYEDMENILAQFSLKAVETMQVTDAYKTDAIDLVKATMQGRYGQDGSKAMFQMLKENGVQLDPALYRQVQQVIEGGRNKFENSQTKLIDNKKAYKTALGSFWQGIWLRVAGYPKIDLSKYEIISSGHAKEAFDTKIDSGIQLRGK